MSDDLFPPCHDIIRVTFEKLSVRDLARAACVCSEWWLIASDPDLIRSSFIRFWKLKEVIGNPSTGKFFLRGDSIAKFVISHKVAPGDTVTGLAIKYNVQVMEIKRVNNMMSCHGIYSRERLLIPIINPAILVNRTCFIEMDAHAKREVAVLYLQGHCEFRTPTKLPDATKIIIESLRRIMKVDDATATYYLNASNGNPRAAYSHFLSDLSWETRFT